MCMDVCMRVCVQVGSVILGSLFSCSEWSALSSAGVALKRHRSRHTYTHTYTLRQCCWMLYTYGLADLVFSTFKIFFVYGLNQLLTHHAGMNMSCFVNRKSSAKYG